MLRLITMMSLLSNIDKTFEQKKYNQLNKFSEINNIIISAKLFHISYLNLLES